MIVLKPFQIFSVIISKLALSDRAHNRTVGTHRRVYIFQQCYFKRCRNMISACMMTFLWPLRCTQLNLNLLWINPLSSDVLID